MKTYYCNMIDINGKAAGCVIIEANNKSEASAAAEKGSGYRLRAFRVNT